MHNPDLHIEYPLGLFGHPFLYKGVCDTPIVLVSHGNEISQAGEEHGGVHHGLQLLSAPVHFSKAPTELNVVQFDCFTNGEAAPGSPLLIQGFLAGREVLDVGVSGRG